MLPPDEPVEAHEADVPGPGATAACLALAGALLCVWVWCFLAARGYLYSLGSFVVCTALTFAAGAALGALLGRVRALALFAIPIWIALSPLLSVPTWMDLGINYARALGLGVALATGAVLVRAGIERLDAEARADLLRAACVAGALFVACWFWEAAAPFAGLSATRNWLGKTLVFALALPALELPARALGRRAGAGAAWGLVLAAPLLAAAAPLLTPVRSRSLPPPHAAIGRPSILLLVLDTVRADHLSLYGYARSTTPRLEAFLARHPRAAVYPRAFSNSNWTVPSHASLLTGRIPSDHGAHFQTGAENWYRIQSEATLAERVREVGYRTAGVFANRILFQVEGLERGFDVFESPRLNAFYPLVGETLRHRLIPGLVPEPTKWNVTARDVNARLLPLAEECASGPCLLFANYMEAHWTYVPYPECRGRFLPWSLRESFEDSNQHAPPEVIERLVARYDESLCSADIGAVELLTGLEERGLLDGMWIFITADHGEGFGEHDGFEHGTSLYAEQVHVPLIVIPPRGERIVALELPVTHVDMAQTIAAIAGTSVAGPGRDLRSGLAGVAQLEFYGDERKAEHFGELARKPARATVSGRWKLVEHGARRELFDVVDDPGETRDRSREHPQIERSLERRLPPLRQTQAWREEPKPVGEDQSQMLRALGYAR